MPEEPNTAEQITDSALYHNRNETIKELAYSNLIERILDYDPSNLGDATLEAIFGGKVTLPGGEQDLLLIVGGNDSIPESIVQLSWGGDLWMAVSVGGGFTGTFRNGRIANNEMIIVGDDEEIQKASGGAFVQKNTGGGERLYAVAFGNNVWLACGANGKILKSTDNGESWADKSYGSADYMGIEYKNGRFVMVDQDGKGLYSTDDGESWTVSDFPDWVDGAMNGLALIEDVFIAYGAAEIEGLEVPVLYLSTNGSVWTQKLITVAEYEGEIWEAFAEEASGVVYDPINDVYLVLTENFFTLFSYDGMETWSLRDSVVYPRAGYNGVYSLGAFFITGKKYDEARLFRTQRLY